MAKSKNRIQTLGLVVVLGVGLLLAFILGLWAFMSFTATALHPVPQDAPSVAGSAPAPSWTAAVDEARRVVRAGLSEQNLTGLSVAVGIGGEVVWAEGFGWADLEQRVPVSPGTRFRIGTASIVLTAGAVGLLVEEGRLKLDERIQTYVPEFPEQEWPVTLRQLMAHVAGVRTDGGDEGPLGEHCERTIEGLRLFADRALLFEPGTRFRFSTFGWILLSAAVEAAAGEPFLTFMERRILEPLRLDDTKAESATVPIANRASFYFPRFAADPRYGLHPTRPLDFSCYAGAMVFLSTPSDLVRYGLAVHAGDVIRPDTRRMLQTPERLASGEETGYGLGWDVGTVSVAGEPTRWVGHNGSTMGGRVVSFLTFPDRGLVVAVMSNLAWADTASVAVGVAEAFAAVERGDGGR